MNNSAAIVLIIAMTLAASPEADAKQAEEIARVEIGAYDQKMWDVVSI